MIFANKQDLAGAKESGEIAALLGLASIKDRSWQIQGGPSRIRKGNLFQSYTPRSRNLPALSLSVLFIKLRVPP